MYQKDTIAAIATPLGRGGIGIIRVSGPLVKEVAYQILGKVPAVRFAEYLPFLDNKGSILDQGIAILFNKPQSFTGEDVLELQGHGGQIILDMLLQRVVSLSGVRIARPGEFSERAFLNDKIDLIQAEATADLINASSERAARSAINSLQGEFSKQVNKIIQAVTDLRVCIEACIDFPDEEIRYPYRDKMEINLNKIICDLNKVCNNATQGNLLQSGIKIVIAGYPNTGKSSLLNILTGKEASIVTNIPGTTRDVIHEYIYLDSILIHITDTAGLHETSNEVEKIGIQRAWHEIKHADHIILVLDSSVISAKNSDSDFYSNILSRFPTEVPITIVRNKVDLTGENIYVKDITSNCSVVTLSAKYGMGVDLLREHLQHKLASSNSAEGNFLARRRHLDALHTAAKHLQQAKEQLTSVYMFEILAEELKLAQKALSKVTGKCSSESLLNKIFSTFCIGK